MEGEAMTIGVRMAGLRAIGTGSTGVNRFAWTAEDRATTAWFEEQARHADLVVERDPAGNLWAHPDSPPPWWAVGSHLDSVRGGGTFDGPLGVSAAFEIAQRSKLPIAVISFADEEGARFNTPTFGSKALTGLLDVESVLHRVDDQGVSIAEAMSVVGVDPTGLPHAPAWLAKLKGFIELHIDQDTLLADAGSPVGIVRELASRMRIEVNFNGQADHAGTTSRRHRHDALGAAARMIVAADDIGNELGELTVTSSRILVQPNATTTIASHVQLWIDARSSDRERPDRWLQRVRGHADQLARTANVAIDITVASQSHGQEFSAALRARLHEAASQLLGTKIPDSVCFAGHDAGVLAAKVPAAMVLVRNQTGVSHSPAECVELADAEIGANLIEQTLRALVGGEDR
jgi:N-carbamoyl-L-amino-acid hydrolase